MKILFIDKSLNKARLIVNLLNAPAEFIICSNAEDGIEKIKAHKDLSLVILDYFIVDKNQKTVDLYKYVSMIRSINHEIAIWLFSNMRVNKGDSFYQKSGFADIFEFTELTVFDQILFALNNMINNSGA